LFENWKLEIVLLFVICCLLSVTCCNKKTLAPKEAKAYKKYFIVYLKKASITKSQARQVIITPAKKPLKELAIQLPI